MKSRNPDDTGKITFARSRIIVRGQAQLISAGEIHYFRLAPEVWKDRLTKLRDAGLNTVSTYVPWLWHELAEGVFDFEGSSHPRRNLVGFIELCSEMGLQVIVKPGPFCMAELKNEGIPSRVRTMHPEIHPKTWDGKPVATMTLDYLAPAFLAEVSTWYGAVMPVLSRYTAPNGGPIVAVQLDNEIGMLSWVSNSPDLTDGVCEEFRHWAVHRYGEQTAWHRIGINSKTDRDDLLAWMSALRSPGDDSLALHHDLGLFMRYRFARYVESLKQLAQENGVRGIPFIINVHGTGGGRARTFPIGISQLCQTWAGSEQITAGSDLYLGDLTVANVADLYIANAMLKAALGSRPLTAMEFEAGNGNYGFDLGELYSPEAVRLKTILSTAQGYRLLNFYMLAGGENPAFGTADDGIDRLASTGQWHGFAAPIGPDGQANATYHAIAQVMASLNGVRNLLSTSSEESDGFALGLVLDHYLSEYRHPRSARRASQVADLERFRGMGPRDILTRALLLGGFSFPCVDLQAGVPVVPVVVLATGRTLGRQVQSNLAEYVLGGGKLLLVGLLPDCDDDGESCTILGDALGLSDAGRVVDEVRANGPYYPTVKAHSWAAPRGDQRVTEAQLLSCIEPQSCNVLLTEIARRLPCAVEVNAGSGKAIVLGCDYPADLDFYRALMGALGVEPRFRLVGADGPGVVITSTVSEKGDRLVHMINVAPQAVSFQLQYRGKFLFGGRRLTVPARGTLLLPFGVRGSRFAVKQATAEILEMSDGKLALNPTQSTDQIVLNTAFNVRCDIGVITRRGRTVEIFVTRHEHRDRPIVISFD